MIFIFQNCSWKLCSGFERNFTVGLFEMPANAWNWNFTADWPHLMLYWLWKQHGAVPRCPFPMLTTSRWCPCLCGWYMDVKFKQTSLQQLDLSSFWNQKAFLYFGLYYEPMSRSPMIEATLECLLSCAVSKHFMYKSHIPCTLWSCIPHVYPIMTHIPI